MTPERKQAEDYLANKGYGSGTNFTVGAVASLLADYASLKLAEEEIELEEKKNCRTCNELGHSCWLHDPSNPSNKLAEATKDMYPKEFLRWVVYEQETFEGELCEELITNHYGRFKSLDELFEYWKQSIRK